MGGGRGCRVSSDGYLEIGYWWSEQHHLDCFGYFVPISLRLVLRIAVVYVLLWSGRHVVNFFPWWNFSTYEIALRIWLRKLSTALAEE